MGLEECFDWRAEFGNDAPLKVEIGPGKGIWLTRMAAATPASSWVGIEYIEKRARWIAQKVARAGLRNVRVIWDDASEALRTFFASGSVDSIHVNFPDPWPKRRHRRRRLIQRPFCSAMASALRPGGRIELVTDVADYALQMVSCLEATPGLENTLGPGGIAAQLDGFLPSIHFEKFALEGRTFHFVRFRRPER